MKAYHKEIVNNVVSYIAKKYYESTGHFINQTLLFKTLALFDFECLKQRGRPCVEFIYTARDRGPVPEELYKRDLSIYDAFKTEIKGKRGYTTIYYLSIKEPNLDYLAPSEKTILDSILERIIKNNLTGEKASDITHKEINAWKIAYKKKHNSIMNYADEFIDLDKKEEKDMTIPELNFIKYMELSNA